MVLCINCEYYELDETGTKWCNIPKGISLVDGTQMFTHTLCENTRYTRACHLKAKHTDVVIAPQPDV